MKSTGGNSVYVPIAVELVNRRSVHLRNFVLNGQESASNPLLHIHADRCTQAETHSKLTKKIIFGILAFVIGIIIAYSSESFFRGIIQDIFKWSTSDKIQFVGKNFFVFSN